MFSNNNVNQLDGEAFQIKANGRISFERNNFLQFSHSALSGMHLKLNCSLHFYHILIIVIKTLQLFMRGKESNKIE